MQRRLLLCCFRGDGPKDPCGPELRIQTTITVWLSIVYIGIFASGLAYFLWYWLLERIRPSQVAIVACTQPPLTALLAWIIFGTVPTYHLFVSGIIVLTGVFLMVGYGGTKRGLGEA